MAAAEVGEDGSTANAAGLCASEREEEAGVKAYKSFGAVT